LLQRIELLYGSPETTDRPHHVQILCCRPDLFAKLPQELTVMSFSGNQRVQDLFKLLQFLCGKVSPTALQCLTRSRFSGTPTEDDRVRESIPSLPVRTVNTSRHLSGSKEAGYVGGAKLINYHSPHSMMSHWGYMQGTLPVRKTAQHFFEQKTEIWVAPTLDVGYAGEIHQDSVLVTSAFKNLEAHNPGEAITSIPGSLMTILYPQTSHGVLEKRLSPRIGDRAKIGPTKLDQIGRKAFLHDPQRIHLNELQVLQPCTGLVGQNTTIASYSRRVVVTRKQCPGTACGKDHSPSPVENQFSLWKVNANRASHGASLVRNQRQHHSTSMETNTNLPGVGHEGINQT